MESGRLPAGGGAPRLPADTYAVVAGVAGIADPLIAASAWKVRAVERMQRRHFAGEFFRRRLRERELSGNHAGKHVVLGRLRAKFLGGFTRGDFSRRVALQDGQGFGVGRTIWTLRLGFAPGASLMMLFHTSSPGGQELSLF